MTPFISRSDLLEAAHLLVLANTPASLFSHLKRTSLVAKLKRCDSMWLERQFDRATAKHFRSETTLAFAYALLVASLLRDTRNSLDPSRLKWGEQMAKLEQESGSTSSRLIITTSDWNNAQSAGRQADSVSTDCQIELPRIVTL